MPTLDWLDRDAAFRVAHGVPTRVLRPHPAAPTVGTPPPQGSELTDGRVFVAEYKGEHLRTAPREIVKRQVGERWAERSGGRAVFAMLFKQDRGMNVAQQIDAALA